MARRCYCGHKKCGNCYAEDANEGCGCFVWGIVIIILLIALL
jgi:hypothetical protein